MVNKRFWAATFTSTGTIIGAGILGLPYVFSKSGFFLGLFWLIFLGIIMMFVNLCLGEVVLRTKQRHQLPGYAKKYLGKNGKKIAFFAILFSIYSALLAYLIGEGQSFSHLFTGGTGYALYFGIGFWLIMSILLREGLRGLKKVETWGVLGIIILILIILIIKLPEIQTGNLFFVNGSNLFFPFGVVLFALLGFTSIPEVRMEIKGEEKRFKKAIKFGIFIPIILYAIFSLVFVGILGQNVSQVATLNFGKIVTILGIFTMMTSYFVLSFSLRDMFIYDLNFGKKKSYFLVTLTPLIFYLIISYFNLLGFVSILSISGVISGGIFGILILMMNKNSKKKGGRKPEYSIKLNKWTVGLISLVFIVGVILELIRVI